MDWRNANLLIWLIPIVGGWLGLSIYAIMRNQSARLRLMNSIMAERLMPTSSPARQIAKVFLQLSGVACLVVALAGPQFGTQIETIVPKGSDLYVLLDVSRSMLANDVTPSRLERAKSDIGALVNSLTGERVGLIAFAGQAVVKVPLTVDYESFRRSLADIDTASAPRGGTAIGDAIRKALEVFKPNSQRDQAILLITDGDDQKSAPLEAADVASERGVTIFAVGLGDSAQGARIPSKDRSGQFLEYEGEQVWSKLDGSLLEQLAVRTKGVYIPAGTKTYDLREIYGSYLADRGGENTETQTRIRRGEQFQWFLGLGVLLLLIDTLVVSYNRLPQVGVDANHYIRGSRLVTRLILFTLFSSMLGASTRSVADDSKPTLQQGLQQYEQLEFAKASELFEKAGESLREAKSSDQYMAYFDQACAEHRLGNRNKAIELYLQAAMSRDRNLAAKSNYNLGRVHVDAAKEIWQDGSKIIEKKEDREKLIDEAKQAIAAYRSSLEFDPNATSARKNIEIVRQWLKVVTDQWNEYDRNKIRKDSDLLQFVDFLQKTQNELLGSAAELKDLHQLDHHAELKLVQDRLLEEFPFLNEKINEALNPNTEEEEKAITEDQKKEVQKVVDLLLGWSDTARDYMKLSSSSLGKFKASESIDNQQSALEELDKIWNAIAPVEVTLERSLSEQRKVEASLKPFEREDYLAPVSTKQVLDQKRVLARAATIKPKAEGMLAELNRTLASQPKSADDANTDTDQNLNGDVQTAQDQSEETRTFLEKAIELSPSAVEEMRLAIDRLEKNDGKDALMHAKSAREILEEILKQKPRDQNQDQQNNNQNQQNQESESQNRENDQKQDADNQNAQNSDSEKQSEEGADDSSSEEKKNEKPGEGDSKEKKDDAAEKESSESQQREGDKDKQNDPKSTQGKSSGDAKTPSQDRIAEALRKVREREAEKRERDRQRRIKAYGQLSVEKDW